MGTRWHLWRQFALVAWALVAIGVFPKAAGAAAPMRRPDEVDPQAARRLQDLFLDISTINLLNGLRLTREQTKAILALAREAEERRNDGRRVETYRKALADAVAAYEAFKAEANKGNPPGESATRRAVHFERRIKMLRNRRAELIDRHTPEFDARLQGILTEGQLQIIETFRPCLVPPKDLKDPVRAGQVASDRGVRMLARVRRVPERLWRERKHFIASRHVEKIGHGRLEITDKEARAAEEKHFIDVVEKARAMSDVEFEMEKSALAQQLSPQERLGQLLERSRVVRSKAVPRQVSRAARWLLHPRIIPILAERLKTGAPFSSAPGASRSGGRRAAAGE